MSNEFFPATELRTSQTSAPELGGADVELRPDIVGQTIPEPPSTLPPMVETSKKPSDDHEKYLLGAVLEAIRLTDLAQNQ